MTNVNYLPTISRHCQQKWTGELIKWSPKGNHFDLLSNSLNSREFVCGYWVKEPWFISEPSIISCFFFKVYLSLPRNLTSKKWRHLQSFYDGNHPNWMAGNLSRVTPLNSKRQGWACGCRPYRLWREVVRWSMTWRLVLLTSLELVRTMRSVSASIVLWRTL